MHIRYHNGTQLLPECLVLDVCKVAHSLMGQGAAQLGELQPALEVFQACIPWHDISDIKCTGFCLLLIYASRRQRYACKRLSGTIGHYIRTDPGHDGTPGVPQKQTTLQKGCRHMPSAQNIQVSSPAPKRDCDGTTQGCAGETEGVPGTPGAPRRHSTPPMKLRGSAAAALAPPSAGTDLPAPP